MPSNDIFNIQDDKLLDTRQSAEILNLRPQTLHRWRSEKIHLAYIKVGRKVLYRASTLKKFINSQTVSVSKLPSKLPQEEIPDNSIDKSVA